MSAAPGAPGAVRRTLRAILLATGAAAVVLGTVVFALGEGKRAQARTYLDLVTRELPALERPELRRRCGEFRGMTGWPRVSVARGTTMMIECRASFETCGAIARIEVDSFSDELRIERLDASPPLKGGGPATADPDMLEHADQATIYARIHDPACCRSALEMFGSARIVK